MKSNRKTNRHFNPQCGGQMNISDFKEFHWIYAHRFVGEYSETGWIGCNIKLETEFTENYTLGNSKINKLKLNNKFNVLSYLDRS